MKQKSDWDIINIGWYVHRLRELLAENPETAFDRIQKEKKERLKAKHLEEPKIYEKETL